MILKHRDIDVLRFDWVEPQGVRVVSVNGAAEQFQPIDFRGAPTDENLWLWLRRRVVPSHRHYIQIMLANLGLRDKNVRDLIGISKGLSLNDVYWVTEDDCQAKWATSNLYSNPFSKVIAQMAFNGGYDTKFDPAKDETTSPEFTTNGMLAKCWRTKANGVYLYKSGTEGAANTGFEPYSEYYAAQVAEAMGLAHVPYGLEMFKGRLCSTCPLFTSEKYGYVPAGRVVDCATALADARFADVFLFDAIIFNTDRHLGNFGYLVDNDTNEIVGAAPIFDNGYGLFSLAMDRPGSPHDEFADLRKFTSRIAPALYANWLGFPGGFTPEMRGKVAALEGFRFKRHQHYNLSDYRLEKIEYFLQKRVSEILEFGVDSDKFIEIAKKNGTVNSCDFEVGTVKLSSGDKTAVIRAIFENVKADPFITLDELAELTGVSRRTLMRYVNDLKRAGAVTRVGPAKTGHWSVDEISFKTNCGVTLNS